MNRLIDLIEATPLFTVAIVVGCFVFLPQVQAVLPPSDGCYANYTTAEGCDALNLLTTGAGNSALGWRSLFLDTTGSFNTGVGGGALALNNGDSNTAVGAAALLLNTSGTENTAVGTDALVYNDSGEANTANGAFALFRNTTGGENTALGYLALSSNTEGVHNTAIGNRALPSTITGSGNTAVGDAALFATTGGLNTAVGAGALPQNTTGVGNTAVGVGAGASVSTADNVICIGSNVAGLNVPNSCFIGNIFGTPSVAGTAVFINSDRKLGTVTSSRRFKEHIQQMGTASEALFALNPVMFHYKKEIDPAGKSQFGLVAEDVEKVNPDLIVRDKEGKPYSVRYDQVNAMLLNEFLKEHKAFVEEQRKVHEQGATIARLQKQIEALTAGLQKVSAQLAAASPSDGGLELSKFAAGRIRRGGPAHQTALNDH